MTGVAALLLLLAPVPSIRVPLDAAGLRTYPEARGMPADVQYFIVQWQDCAHWIGEPAWDQSRQRQIDRAVASVCPGVDARGHRLRHLYAHRPAILARIAHYEDLGQ